VRPPEAAAGAVSRRGAQQAALGVFDSARADRGIPRRGGLPPGAGRRIRLRPAVSSSSPIEKKLPRHGHKDLHLFLCDDIWFMDRKKEQIERYQYDFERESCRLAGLARTANRFRRRPRVAPGPIVSDHTPEEYMAERGNGARGHARGDYYEVVLRQTFSTPYSGKASELFERVQRASPSPYEFLLQFGDEQLVGASPEMFVRVEGQRVETCPIAGTAQRTGDPMRDADNIRELLKSTKEESELTMCTDVDRNDKSRVCEPGTVKVIGRRLIESYAGVFHTVDHVEGSSEGRLRFAGRVPQPHVGGDADRRAEEGRRAGHRERWKRRARLVRRRGGHDLAERRYQYRHPDSHHAICATAWRLSGGRDAALRFDPEMEERETRLKATGFFRTLGAARPRRRRGSPRRAGRRREAAAGG
jgi:hypothetical protein